MPIPFLLGAVAVAAAGLGAVGHAVAKETNEEAQSIINKVERRYNDSLELLDEKKQETSDILAEYGKMKIQVCSGAIRKYVDITNKLSSKNKMIMNNNLNHKRYDLSHDDLVSNENFSEIEVSSMKSTEILASGITSLGSGALISMGTYGGVSMLATASTGTAIASLSGVAATNATMAWLGGGSLAAGGLGMAGGAAMLGGIALGPAVLVSSIFAGVKSEENLENAKLYKKEVNLKIVEIDRVVSHLEAIQLRTKEGSKVLKKLYTSLECKLDDYEYVVEKQLKISQASFFEKLIDKWKAKFTSVYNMIYVLSEEDKKIVLITELLVKKIYEVLNTPLIDENGDFTYEFNLLVEEENIDKILNIAG